MTTVDLDAIRARHQAFEAAWDHEFCGPDGPKRAAASAEDVPALLDEIASARRAGLESLHATVLRQLGAVQAGNPNCETVDALDWVLQRIAEEMNR